MPVQRQWYVYFGDKFPGFRGILIREGERLSLITSAAHIPAPAQLSGSPDLILCKSEMDALRRMALQLGKEKPRKP